MAPSQLVRLVELSICELLRVLARDLDVHLEVMPHVVVRSSWCRQSMKFSQLCVLKNLTSALEFQLRVSSVRPGR